MKTILFIAGFCIGVALGIILGFNLTAPPLIAIIDSQIGQLQTENKAFREAIFDKEGLAGRDRQKRRGR